MTPDEFLLKYRGYIPPAWVTQFEEDLMRVVTKAADDEGRAQAEWMS